MEEQVRKDAIERYLKGELPKTIYSELHRSKYWFFKWLKRFRSGRPDWYQDQWRKEGPVNWKNFGSSRLHCGVKPPSYTLLSFFHRSHKKSATIRFDIERSRKKDSSAF